MDNSVDPLKLQCQLPVSPCVKYLKCIESVAPVMDLVRLSCEEMSSNFVHQMALVKEESMLSTLALQEDPL